MSEHDGDGGVADGDPHDSPGRARRSRFIAGAVCPSCGAMDRIVVDVADSGESARRCVACGFADELMPASGSLPQTRFSRPPDDGDPEDAGGRDRVTPVRIVQPGAKNPD